uniref:Uncharacterized protein n=1 Tax=Arundo donax TaxID=35708 RepID=A0A0A9ALI0_ARUDO
MPLGGSEKASVQITCYIYLGLAGQMLLDLITIPVVSSTSFEFGAPPALVTMVPRRPLFYFVAAGNWAAGPSRDVSKFLVVQGDCPSAWSFD